MNYLVPKARKSGLLFMKCANPINLAAFCGQNDVATFIKHLSHRGNIYNSPLSPFDGRRTQSKSLKALILLYNNIHIHLHAEISLKYLQKYPQHFGVLYLCIYVNDCMVRLKYIICFYHCKRYKYKSRSKKIDDIKNRNDVYV